MLECSYKLGYVAAVSGLNRLNITAHKANLQLTRKVLALFNILTTLNPFLFSHLSTVSNRPLKLPRLLVLLPPI